MDLETLWSWNSGGSIAAVLNFGVGTAPHWVQKSLSAGLRSAPWQKTRRESVRTWGKIWEKMNQIIHEMWCCWWFFVHWNLHKSKLDSAHLFHPYLYHPLFESQHVGCIAETGPFRGRRRQWCDIFTNVSSFLEVTVKGVREVWKENAGKFKKRGNFRNLMYKLWKVNMI